MTSTSPGASAVDPLTVLPPEIVLRILEFTSISALASLTAASKAWHGFIDVTHQEAIYSSESKTTQPPGGARDFSFLSESTSLSKLFEDTQSWKDLCKRQTSLARNWADPNPLCRESVLQVGNDPVWRFRADFKRRFIVSTAQAGGLNVTDMDSGSILWRLPSTLDRDGDAVRPFAHLEYQDGMAVFDREGDAVEVWQADQEGAARGEFRRIAILNHNCQTRGFQLSHWTLCVVSSQGQGFVYDMTECPPKLTTRVKIEHGAVGHLDQSKDVVIYSMGAQGYHAYSKATGAFLGALHPSQCTEKYHLIPPASPAGELGAAIGAAHQLFPPKGPGRACMIPVQLAKGPLQPPNDPEHVYNVEDQWGAGMLHGDLFVGYSRAGRVFICSNWRKALENQESLAAHSSLLECESDGSSFDLGGWLSVRNHRVLFEVKDRAYIVALDDNNRMQDVDNPTRASYSLVTSSIPRLSVPVSFMALYDDAIMTTYTTLGWRQPPQDFGDGQPRGGPARIFPTKAIRIVNLASELSDKKGPSASNADTPRDPARAGGYLQPPGDDVWRSQAGLLQLVTMLRDEFGDEEDDDEEDDGPGVMVTDGDDGEWEDEDDDEEHEHEHEHEPTHAHQGT